MTTLTYSPLTSHTLYRLPTAGLYNHAVSDADVAKTIVPLSAKGFASDGLLGSSTGVIYVTDYEHKAIRELKNDKTWSLVVQDDKLILPDSMAISSHGSLFVTSTQINRGKDILGTDQRVKPFKIFKVDIGTQPLFLGSSSH